MVSGVDRGGPHSEDLGWSEDVALEAESVVGDPQRRLLTVKGVGSTVNPLTVSVRGRRRTRTEKTESKGSLEFQSLSCLQMILSSDEQNF